MSLGVPAILPNASSTTHYTLGRFLWQKMQLHLWRDFPIFN